MCRRGLAGHDRHPTACVGDAAFAHVDAFSAHVNLGFFLGTSLPDPARLLEGTGKIMRHVKLRPGQTVDEAALAQLIAAAYRDMQARVVPSGRARQREVEAGPLAGA